MRRRAEVEWEVFSYFSGEIGSMGVDDIAEWLGIEVLTTREIRWIENAKAKAERVLDHVASTAYRRMQAQAQAGRRV